MEPSPNNIAIEAWHVVIALLGAAAAWAWKFVTGDISTLKKISVTKDEFGSYADHAQKQRDELRTAVIDLYKQQKEAEERQNDRHIELLNAIHEARK